MKPDFQLYTLEEAKAKGLPYEKQEERVCEHCGKPLEWLGIISKDGFGEVGDGQGLRLQRKERSDQAAGRGQGTFARGKGQTGGTYQVQEGGNRQALFGGISFGTRVHRYVNTFADANGKASTSKERRAEDLRDVRAGEGFVFAGYSVKATTTLAMLNSIHDSYNGSEHDGVRSSARWTSSSSMI